MEVDYAQVGAETVKRLWSPTHDDGKEQEKFSIYFERMQRTILGSEETRIKRRLFQDSHMAYVCPLPKIYIFIYF